MSPNDLGLTADLLIREFDEAVVGSSLVRFVQCDDDPDQVEIGIRPLDGHPTEELAGFRAPESWVAVVKPGRVLFELEGIPKDIAIKAMALASAKMPIRTKFVVREDARSIEAEGEKKA